LIPMGTLNVIKHLLAKSFSWSPLPFNLTISTTMRCQSKCLTCNIPRIYRTYPDLVQTELTANEWEQIFKHLGKSYLFITYSGGEPFLRNDLLDLLQFSIRYGNPKFIAIPSNGLMPQRIHDVLNKFLTVCPQDVEVHFNLSLDGIGEIHDKVRGVPNNFSTSLETLSKLTNLKQKYPQLKISIHTVISKFNAKSNPIATIQRYFYDHPEFPIDNFISEIAEQRFELGTMGVDLTPPSGDYATAIQPLLDLRTSLKTKLRNKYYQDVLKYLFAGGQVIPCMAGRASAHITAWGQVVACCIRWLEKGYMGDLRLANYDMRRIWNSPTAKEMRKSISSKECSCPMANVYYSSLCCNLSALLKAMI